jgi:threonine/homoserine/homoserine lactone efflux protein
LHRSLQDSLIKEIDMPALSTIALFLLAGLGILVIPGPAVLYIVTRSIAQGRRAGLASVGGIETANLVHLVAAAVGLSALLMTSALAFSVVKYLGAAYLIYLGVRTLLMRKEYSTLSIPTPKKLPQLYANGFLVNLLSPKAALFYYAFLPQFIDPARGAAVEQLLILGGSFALLASCTDSLYALIGSTMGQWLRRSVRFQQIQRYVTGSIYILLGLITAVAGSEKHSP